MLIELIGPAGVGKTSTAGRVETLLRERSIDVLGLDELQRLEHEIGIRSLKALRPSVRRRVMWGLGLRHPDILLPILLLFRIYGPEESSGRKKRRQRRAWRAIGHVRLALALRDKIGRDKAGQNRAAGRVVLLHEGFTQVLWTLVVDSPALKAKGLIRFVLARYHAAMQQRGLRLVVDDQTVIQRVFAREPEGRFNRESTAAQRQAFPRWLDYHRELVALLPRGLMTVDVDGSMASDQVAKDVAAAVEAQLPVGDQGSSTQRAA